MKRILSVFVALTAAVAIVGPAVAADQSMGEKLDDAKITTAVKTKLAADKLKTLVNVGVETNGGIVRLYGKVPTAEDKFEAERVVRRAKGVKDVNNELRVEASNSSQS